ncbi:unnamed protein product [Pleuronectes platessa]|uniref:Uncharacterized protein n=1 Tax=Pleuronectes platessa TaxID=8262 RepID=A0A9N7UTV5_PLEPL|nr:unnamed protein product [Pleuronectes platessa]
MQFVDQPRLTDRRLLSEEAGTDFLAAQAHEQRLGGDTRGQRIHLSPRQPPSLLHPRVSKDISVPLALTSAQSFPVGSSYSGKPRNCRVAREETEGMPGSKEQQMRACQASPSLLMPLIIHAVYTVCPSLPAQAPPELVNCVCDTVDTPDHTLRLRGV